jgi:hypothetical protein
MRAPETLTTGLFPPKQHFYELHSYEAMTEAAVSLIAQLYSQGKLSSPRR